MKVSPGRFSASPATISYLVRFFELNVLFALVPLIMAAIARWAGNVQAPLAVYAPELLFFGLMISASALADISDKTKLFGNSVTLQLLSVSLRYCAVITAVTFGMYQYYAIIAPPNLVFGGNIGVIAFTLAIAQFIAGLFAEILIGVTREAPSVQASSIVKKEGSDAGLK
jgi:hypothetical protein